MPRQASSESAGRSALREFAVVVLGVLVALAAQSWWESRHERSIERDYLRQLLSDTRVNEARLSSAIEQDSAAGVAAMRALTALDRPGPPPAADSLIGWVGIAAGSANFFPLDGSYKALIATGDLRLIRTDTLRAMIIAYAAALDRETGRLEQIRGSVFGMVGPFARAIPFIRGAFLDGPDPRGVDVEQLRRSQEPAVVLFMLQAANVNTLSGLRNLRSITIDLRKALEAESGLTN